MHSTWSRTRASGVPVFRPFRDGARATCFLRSSGTLLTWRRRIAKRSKILERPKRRVLDHVLCIVLAPEQIARERIRIVEIGRMSASNRSS